MELLVLRIAGYRLGLRAAGSLVVYKGRRRSHLHLVLWTSQRNAGKREVDQSCRLVVVRVLNNPGESC
jgi:hypothetical protein